MCRLMLLLTLLVPATAAAKTPRKALDSACGHTTAGVLSLAGPDRLRVAQAAADRLSAKLRRVSAARYIGETEKNLDALLDEAARDGVVLFFDEADAIFGKRTGVKDAHDRYADLEARVAARPSLVVLVGLTRPSERAVRVDAGAAPWPQLCPRPRP